MGLVNQDLEQHVHKLKEHGGPEDLLQTEREQGERRPGGLPAYFPSCSAATDLRRVASAWAHGTSDEETFI